MKICHFRSKPNVNLLFRKSKCLNQIKNLHMFCKANYAESNNGNCFETRRSNTEIYGSEKIDGFFFFGNIDSVLLVKTKVLKVESEIYSYLK